MAIFAMALAIHCGLHPLPQTEKAQILRFVREVLDGPCGRPDSN